MTESHKTLLSNLIDIAIFNALSTFESESRSYVLQQQSVTHLIDEVIQLVAPDVVAIVDDTRLGAHSKSQQINRVD